MIGLCLFVLFELVASDDAACDSKVINIDRESLLTFMQYRMRAFEPKEEHLRIAVREIAPCAPEALLCYRTS